VAEKFEVNTTGKVSILRCFQIGLFVTLLCSTAFSLDRDRTITQLYHTAWTAKEGAPNQINALAQTSDGYLWLGSSTGLYRFDGILFERIEPRSGETFPSNNIFALLASSDGGLWIGFWYGGVGYLKDGNLTNYTEQEGLPTGRIRSLARDNDGVVWVAAASGLGWLEGGKWQQAGPEQNFPGKGAQAVVVDSGGTLWVATENTIVFLPKGTRSFQPTNENVGRVLRLAQSTDGAIWMAEVTRSARPVVLPGVDPRSLGPEIQVGSFGLVFDREGGLWVTSLGDGIRRVPYVDRFRGRKIAQFSNDAEIFTEKEGLTGDYSPTALEDREGNIWIGTSNGLDRFRESDIVPVRFPAGYENFGLAAGDEGDVWTATSNRGASRIRGGLATPVGMHAGFHCIFRDERGVVWMGGTGYIFRYEEGKYAPVNAPASAKNFDISTLFLDHSGVLWIHIDQQGFLRLENGVWTNYEKQSELPKLSPISAFIDPSDRKWLGYAGNVLAVIDNERVETFTSDDGLQVGDVVAVRGRSQRTWVGGTLGLAVLEGSRFRMLAGEGEGLTGVSGIVEMADGALWLNESHGIAHIPASEIQLALDDPNHKVRYKLFNFLDGLPGTAQQHKPFPTAVEGSDGRLWFSTNKGVAWIDPARISRNTIPPPVTVRSLSADEQVYESAPAPHLPKGTTSLRISYTALSLSIPERARFRYRLEGVDNEWQEAGPRREAYYTNLGPGSYRFQVIAANSDGIWNEEGAVIDFKILPLFYQTNWFILLCLAAAGCAAWLAYKWRVKVIKSRLHMQFEERFSERTRIAQDLHDTLLQGFVSASMQLDVVVDQLPVGSAVKPRLDRIHELIGQVIEEGRNTVKGLRSNVDGSANLEKEFARTREELDFAEKMNFRIIVEGASRSLYPTIHDEVYHIGHEAIVNAFRHSGADLIEVEMEYAARNFRMSVRDNGSGIDQEILGSGREGHWGLSGMKERAEKIGASLKVLSSAAAGTEIELSVPNEIAFQGQRRAPFWSRMFPRKAEKRGSDQGEGR
jgi:signal transduction histidine kinase/ligand-binding sensor domain-containing protein